MTHEPLEHKLGEIWRMSGVLVEVRLREMLREVRRRKLPMSRPPGWFRVNPGYALFMRRLSSDSWLENPACLSSRCTTRRAP